MGPIKILLALLLSGEGLTLKAKKTVCDYCRLSLTDIPYYCSIKADLPQCIFPMCPKTCGVDAELKDSSLISVKRSKAQLIGVDGERIMASLPPYLPRAAKEYYIPVKSFEDEEKELSMEGMGRSMVMNEQGSGSASGLVQENEVPERFDEQTCKFTESTAIIRELREGSKYVIYTPPKGRKSVVEVKEFAQKYGLVLGEVRSPQDYLSLSKSELISDMAKRGNDELTPLFAYDLKDIPFLDSITENKTKNDHTKSLGNFTYESDQISVSFAVIDPRQFGRTDENCGVWSYFQKAGSKAHLITLLRNCYNSTKENEILYGLLMYPVGSFCYRTSEEECNDKRILDASKNSSFHSIIEIGQTRKRFIYFYSDQRSWFDARQFCAAKGLKMFDLDPTWDDAIRSRQLIENFLIQTQLNPLTMLWTSGKFKNNYADRKFVWESTHYSMQIGYKDPPYEFSWWDTIKGINASVRNKISRRKLMKEPCVGLAINPKDKDTRPKISFRAWYCHYPAYFLCYKEINKTDHIDDGPTPITTTGVKPYPAEDACIRTNVSLNNATDEKIEPFDENCVSTSNSATRLSITSKFVIIEPKVQGLTVEEVKQKCYAFNLVPAEIRTVEDWLSIKKGGLGNIFGSDNENSNYVYVTGTEDTDELGKFVYNSSQKLIKFSMFFSEGDTNTNGRCIVLDTVTTSDNTAREIMMHSVDCKKHSKTGRKVLGLCMFKPSSHCFKTSNEEEQHIKDNLKSPSIIPLGLAKKRSIFFNPMQRDWEESKRFCEGANLKLLDFDTDDWGNDLKDVIRLWKEKVADTTDLNRMAPIWTSGKIKGIYSNSGASGTWESTKGTLNFLRSPNQEWIRYKWENLTELREGSVHDGCVEASFDDFNYVVKLRPDFCNIPKFFLCYRKSRKRCCDPPASNNLGINIIETGDLGNNKNSKMTGSSGQVSSQPNDLGKFPAGHQRSNDFAPSDGEKESSEYVSESSE